MAKVLTKIPKFRRCVLQNFPFIEQDFDALTDYQLLCKVVEYLNKVINSQNEVITITESLIASFNELQSFVQDYFDNLDVQEEINNKLDQMAESGQLTDIIAQYLGLAGMIVFDTVSDMKSAENLVNGSKCYTLGYHSVNDGGSAVYKVRTILNTDDVNEMNLIALHDITLVAELNIADDVNVKQLGAYGDGTNDDTDVLEFGLTEYNAVYLPSGNYLISDELPIKSDNHLHGNGATSIIKFNYTYTDTIKYALKASTNVRHLIIENISIYTSNVNSLTGGIYVNSATRGNAIKDVWFTAISNPIYLGNEIWGNFALKNIYANYFPDDQDETLRLSTVGISCNTSNTVVADNIEILGSFHYGIYLDHTKVTSFTNANVSGSGSYKLDTAFRIVDCHNIKIDTAWCELVEGDTHNTETIYVKDTSIISLSNINIANGAMWIDGCSDVELTNNRFTTANGGLRWCNNSQIDSDRISLGYCNYQGNAAYVSGNVYVRGIKSSSENIKNNPIMLMGMSTDLVKSNNSVTVADDTSDYVTGDRSRKFTTVDYQGAKFSTSMLKEGHKYTVIVLAKAVSGIDSVYLTCTNAAVASDFPNATVTGTTDDFVYLKLTFTQTATSTEFKILNRLTSGESTGILLIDSIYIYEGEHNFEIGDMDKDSLLANEKVFSDYVPYTGTWKKGDTIYNSFNVAASDGIRAWVYDGSAWKVISMPA